MNKRPHLIAVILIVTLAMGITVILINRKGQEGTINYPDATVAHGEETGEHEESETGSGITVTRSDELIEAENAELLEVYKSIREDNPDFAGFLRILGTKIEYPVMYTPYEPEKYIHMDIYGVESDDGLPFIDARCSIEPDSDNVIMYGHNMKDGSMFSSLIQYQDKSYFKEHPIIRYDSPDEIREYEVMSAFYDRVYYTDETDVFKFYDFIDASDKEEFDHNVSQYLKKSIYDTGVTAEYGDKLITLVTCAYHTENGRFVVVARRK
ncbi:MAG: class B sortase [Lachnospiraceae bacterium]|nr:class B sortase [Lachnospiraceae bacterium]